VAEAPTLDDGYDICAACHHRRDQHASWWDGATPDQCRYRFSDGSYCGCEEFIEHGGFDA